MPKDNDMMSVSACAKLVGKHPPQLYKFIKDEGMPSHKDSEGNVRVVLSEVKAFLEARDASPRARGGAATKDAVVSEAIGKFIQPFKKVPVLSLWDRGNDKGWAVAAITNAPEIEYDVDEATGQRQQRLVAFKVDYSKSEPVWADDRIIQEVIAGKIVLAEPQGVLRLIATQLSLFDPAERPTPLIEKLEDLAEMFDGWKESKLKPSEDKS